LYNRFADVAALYASSCDGFEAVGSSFSRLTRGWDLTVSLIKSKGMVAGIGAGAFMLSPIIVEENVVDL